MANLVQFINELQTDKNFGAYDEASVKLSIILKILSLLGWDLFDVNEIQPDYNTNKQKIDFVLKQNDSLEVFLMVKKDFYDSKSHIETLLYSSEMSAVKIAIYTNGFSWSFFLPYADGSIDDKKFCVIDTGKDKTELIARGLHDFLSKENVISGHAVKLAEEICNKRKAVMSINATLPMAWEKVINEPEKYLIDVISKVTKELCGYKPDQEEVVDFIRAKGKIRSIKSENYEMEDLTQIGDDKPQNRY